MLTTPVSIAEQRHDSTKAFSSEADTGSREENAPKQEARAPVLIQSEPEMLWTELDPASTFPDDLPTGDDQAATT
jgi:hypothetical protein